MNCAVRTCTRTAQVHEPLPLCGTCALRAVANYATANLAGSTNQVRQTDANHETGTTYQLLNQDGWNAVDLNRAMQVPNRPKVTGARRLAKARKKYAAELGRRTHREPQNYQTGETR